MSRHLLILRHAKSDWDTDAATDFERPLAKRGERDAPRIGRPPIYNAEQQQRLRELVDEEPRQLKRAQARLAAETGKPAGTRTLTRILKNFRCVRKRCRLSLKARRDQQAFDQADKVLGGLHQLEQRGKLNVFYFDESGVSLTSVVPYARQPINETSELPAFSHQRVNLPGFMNRADELHHTTVEGRVNGRTVIAAIDQFIERLDSDVPTVVVLDNAGIHTSAEVLARRDRRLARGLILYYLPTCSPELNLIEILWRKLKYEWLPFSAYLSFAALKSAIAEVVDNIGKKYQITFV